MTTGDALLQAWEIWDRNPRAEWAARGMVDATHATARELGISSNQLRRQLATARRNGRGRSETIDSLRDAA